MTSNHTTEPSEEDRNAAERVEAWVDRNSDDWNDGIVDDLRTLIGKARALSPPDDRMAWKVAHELEAASAKLNIATPEGPTRLAASREGGELVELAIKQINGRFPNWSPTPAMLGYARAVAKTVAALAFPAPMPETDEITEALKEFVRMEKSIMADIRTAHNRGPAATEWMRDDDRDMRDDLAKAFQKARAALGSVRDKDRP